jgi:hypothetical protein
VSAWIHVHWGAGERSVGVPKKGAYVKGKSV